MRILFALVVILYVGAIFGVSTAQASEPQDFRFETEDGYDLAGRFFGADDDPAEVRPTLILVHGSGVDKERWERVEFVEDLIAAGWHVISFDMRGRGDSQAPPQGTPFMLPYADIDAAVAWALADPRVDADQLVLIGESFGANLIVTGMQRSPWPVQTIVSLSATRVVFMWPIERTAPLIGGLFVGSTDDPYPAVDAVARVLEAMSRGEARSVVVDERSHGVGVLLNEDTRAVVMEWLHQTLDD